MASPFIITFCRWNKHPQKPYTTESLAGLPVKLTMRVLPCRVNNRAELLPYMEIRTRMEYNDTIQSVKGIGEKTAGLFSKLNVRTVGELCEYYPSIRDSRD